MRGLSSIELLDVWERGTSQRPVYRALLLLGAMQPQFSMGALANLFIGERDTLLMHLRVCTFGTEFEAVAACPQCKMQLELEFSFAQIRAMTQKATDGTVKLRLEHGEFEFRLPTSADLIAVGTRQDTTPPRANLLSRCRVSGDESTRFSPDEQQQIASALAECDPRADIEVMVDCPSCQLPWTVHLDIVTYFWDEIDRWARHILSQVHVLASRYGWSEREIVSLSPQRRQFYLDL